MRLDAEQAITQINQLLAEWERLTAQSKYDDLSDLPLADLQALKTRAAGAIRRWSNEIGRTSRMQGVQTCSRSWRPFRFTWVC